MATQSSTVRNKLYPSFNHNCDDQLEKITSHIQAYLLKTRRNRLYLTISRKHYRKCYKSWVKINDHLNKFLLAPRANYSVFMYVLENDIHKFPKRSYYRKQLEAMAKLIAQGPNFNNSHVNQFLE